MFSVCRSVGNRRFILGKIQSKHQRKFETIQKRNLIFGIMARISSFVGHGDDDGDNGNSDEDGVDSSLEREVDGYSVCVAAWNT